MGINAFQHTAFQQSVGLVAFQELTVVSVVTGGRQLFDDTTPWEYVPLSDTLYRHMAAVLLGRQGASIRWKK